MELAARPGVAFGASQSGGFIWPRFLPAYDAAATLVMLVELLAAPGRVASPSWCARCPGVHVTHETVPTALGVQGPGHADPGRADWPTARPCWSTG